MGTRLKLSLLMPIAGCAVIFRVQNLTGSVLFSVVLFLSVFLHEIVHVWISHRRRIHCPERILWPFGGLSGWEPEKTDPFVALTGLSVNLSLALLAASQLVFSEEILPLLNPSTSWQTIESEDMPTLLLRMTFLANSLIVVANLIPVRPMVTGYVLQSWLSRRFSRIESRDLLLRSGLVISLIGLLVGFVIDLSGVVALSALFLLLHVQEAVQWFHSRAPAGAYNKDNDSHRQFEHGHYESEPNEFEDEEGFSGSVTGLWKSRRESERELRERELAEREHDELDRVLEKLHTQGRDSLTNAEVRLLNRVSARLRQKNH